MQNEKLKLLYTEIGRGHPFYLDGIIDELNRNGGIDLVHSKSSVFEYTDGLSLKMWQLVRALYLRGGKEGVVSVLYKRIRKNNDYNEESFALTLLGRDINRKLMYDMSPLVVAHPILISILKGRKNLYYQHGELITPAEAVVGGAEKIFVPIESSAVPFKQYYNDEQIVITGLCIEPSIERIAQDSFEARIKRYDSQESLTGCFISSGAEPISHVRIIIESLMSLVHAGGKAFLFVKKDGILESAIEKKLYNLNLQYLKISSLEKIPHDLPPLVIVQFSNRRDENRFTSHFFSQFDFIVSPSHERSNWAVGLGLPMFICEPAIGPFSPLNRQFLLDSQTSQLVKNEDDAKSFALNLKKMHISGNLKMMSQSGWGKYPIDGFLNIVRFFKNISLKSS